MSAIHSSDQFRINPPASRYGYNALALFAFALIVVSLPFYDGISYMVRLWINKEEYSHGFFLPVIAVFMVWQKRFVLEQLVFKGSYFGIALVLFGMILCLIGDLATVFEVIEYGYIIALSGLILSLVGLYPFKYFILPIVLLLFMVPLPNFLYNNLSSELQLISSKIGVYIIRLFDIPVFLQGNVIDLGEFKLQVVEACSGLRYLFPLTALTFIVVCFYRAHFFLKVFVFLSSIPITILMNSFRISLIAIAYHFFSLDMAEGILHDFEGWVIFMSSMILILLEIKILALIMGDKRSLSGLISVDIPQNPHSNNSKHISVRKINKPFYISLFIIIIFNIFVFYMPKSGEIIPDRSNFIYFPTVVNEWTGHRETLGVEYLNQLKLSDYILSNYSNHKGDVVNFYSAYYDSQQKGVSAHSPKSCLPGDGWQLIEFDTLQISDGMKVNRVLMAKGKSTTLLYYWFDQRGRIITNEYLVKWYLFWDSLTKNRSDGALLRLTTEIYDGESIEDGEDRLMSFLSAIEPRMKDYVPD